FTSFVVIAPPPRSTLLPYTTLFRSRVLTTADAIALPGDQAATGAGETAPLRAVGQKALVEQELDDRVVLRGAEQEDRPLDGEPRSEEHTSELQSRSDLVCRLLLEKK